MPRGIARRTRPSPAAPSVHDDKAQRARSAWCHQPREVDPALDGQPVRDLFNAPNGTLWAATAGGGLVRLRGTAICALTTRHGLPSDHLSAVVLDAQGFFWLSGRQALYRLRHDDATAVLDGQRAHVVVVPLLPSAGHLGSSTKLAEIAQAADGSLWIPSFKGVTRLDPAQYAAQFDEPLPLHVEALATEQGGGQPLRADMQLPVGQRTVTLRYTAPDLHAPQCASRAGPHQPASRRGPP